MSLNKEELFYKCLDAVNERGDQYDGNMKTISGEIEKKKFHPQFDAYGNKGILLNEFEKSADHLDRVRSMKETLANLDIKHRSEVVRPGSVVETQHNYYFISVPLGEITLDSGQKVYAISTESPIYQHLEGKKAGDHFTFNDSEVEIVQVL